MKRLTFMVLAALALAACGRVGPPRPPGPAEAISFPRSFPALTAQDRIEVNANRAAQGLPPLPLPRGGTGR